MVLSPAELPDDPHAVAVGLFELQTTTSSGGRACPAIRSQFGATPASLTGNSPALGEHTDAILTELGLGGADRRASRRGRRRLIIAADIYKPGEWTDFFLLVGTGAVTLTGLVFVAMSLNLRAIAVDATHRYRAINTLTGLALVFMRCALVLMGAQNHQSIGAELFVVSGISAAIFVRGYARAIRMSTGLRTLSHRRREPHTPGRDDRCGGVLLRAPVRSLHCRRALVVNTCYMITAAWLLVIGTFDPAS